MKHLMPRLYEFKTFSSNLRPFKAIVEECIKHFETILKGSYDAFLKIIIFVFGVTEYVDML